MTDNIKDSKTGFAADSSIQLTCNCDVTGTSDLKK